MGHLAQAALQTHHQAALLAQPPAAHREPAVHRLFWPLWLARVARRKPRPPARAHRPRPCSK